MLTTLLVIGGVLVGLVALLALIVSLSARPVPTPARGPAARGAGWVADTGRSHPDAWSAPTAEIPAAR